MDDENDFSVDELLDMEMDEAAEKLLEKQARETREHIEKLEAQRKELDRQIRLLKDPKSRIHSRARFTKDEKKEKWQIAVVGSFYLQKRVKGETWFQREQRPYTERMERWIPIIQGSTEEEAKKELKATIKALQKLDKEINKE
jgi:DNA repair exonuclease SbcCD ATPase subunit